MSETSVKELAQLYEYVQKDSQQFKKWRSIISKKDKILQEREKQLQSKVRNMRLSGSQSFSRLLSLFPVYPHSLSLHRTKKS